MNMSDAVVAIRSLSRRFGEVVGGPDDDAWDRRVRAVGSGGRSALGFVRHVTELLDALGTAIASLPVQSRPKLALGSLEERFSEPPSDVSGKQALQELRAAAEHAAGAVAGRSHDELDRSCSVDGRDEPARSVVERILATAVAHLKDAQRAIDDAS